MADTTTSHYSWVKPEIAASNATWGGKLNADLDGIDGQVFTASTQAAAALPMTGGTATGPIILAADPTVALGAATKQYVDAGSPPVGSIIMFGATASPSPNWLVCNGASYATATYPALFAAIGYAFGGSGATFNVPDFGSSIPWGPWSGAIVGNNTYTLADTGPATLLTVQFLIRAT